MSRRNNPKGFTGLRDLTTDWTDNPRVPTMTQRRSPPRKPKPATDMQKTLILLKPDAVQRRLVGSIIQRFEQKGLRIGAMKLVHPDRSLAERHYAVHKGKPFYESLLQFLTSGPTVAMILEGREAVTVCRNLMGVTDGSKAGPGTIRGDYALRVKNNLIHGSDRAENGAAEIALWFDAKEQVSYTATDASWVG